MLRTFLVALVAIATGGLQAGPPILEVKFVSGIDPKDQPEVRKSQHLLYQVYVEEDGWLPEGDPTNIRVEERDGLKLLVNDYDDVAMRFNAYVGEELAGTIRLAGSIDGKYELQHYADLPPEIVGTAKSPVLLFEVNRLAVHKQFRSQKDAMGEGNAFYWVKNLGTANERPLGFFTVYQALMKELTNTCTLRDIAFFAAPHRALARVLPEFGLEISDTPKFKYTPSDNNFVQKVFYYRPAEAKADMFGNMVTLCQYHSTSLEQESLCSPCGIVGEGVAK